MVVMDKSSYIDKCMALLQTQMSTSLAGTHRPNSQRSPGNSSQTQGKIWKRTPMGAVTIQSTASPQVIPVHLQDLWFTKNT